MMVLVDTSVWIDHLRNTNPRLQDMLRGQHVLTHPFIIGEIACGHLDDRPTITTLLNGLQTATIAQHTEAIHFLNKHHLHGHGLGWIDIHLLASAVLTRCALWSNDRRLRIGAEHVGVAVVRGT